MSFSGHLNKKADIERATSSVSDEGYVTNTWNEIAADVKCSLQKARGATYQDAAGEVHEADYIAYFEAGTDIAPESSGKADRVTIDGQYYSVVDVKDAAGKARLLEVFLKRM